VQLRTLIKKLLNVKDVIVEQAYFEEKSGDENLVIKVRQPERKKHRCGICGKKAPGYDRGRGARRWRAMDFGPCAVFIEAEAPRVCCKEHGVVTEKVGWARHGSMFTYDFENMVAWLTLHSQISVVAEFMRIAWNTVGPIVRRVHDDIRRAGGSLFDGLVRLGIDETSYKKGHKYMTVVVNHDTGKLIWAAKGHGKAVLDQFFGLLTPGQRAGIEHVTADGARWIAESASEWCPNAERSIDPFHVVQWATDALDEVRRLVWREAREAGKAGKAKRGRGRPKRGEETGKEKPGGALKGARYPLSKNPENLNPGQAAALEFIAKSNPKLYRAYLLKEKLRLIFQHPLEAAKKELKEWIDWARRCRIPHFVEFQRKICRHADAILSTIKHGLSNAKIEAINNKIKLTVRMGFGFRNIDNLIAMVMLRCSGINLMLPRFA
jgi:transposase